MAIRGAMGANRIRLLRQCLVESMVLACGGAVLGIALAEGILESIRVWGPQSVPRLHDVALHPTVFAFTLLITLATAMMFGFVPAWKMSRIAPIGSLRSSAQTTAGRGGNRIQNAIAVSEVALALVLLIAGGLLVRSLAQLLSTPVGFDPTGRLIVRTMFDHARYPDAARRNISSSKSWTVFRICQELQRLPRPASCRSATSGKLACVWNMQLRTISTSPPTRW